MKFNPGFDIEPTTNPMGFVYGPDVFGPPVENRLLKDIRKSLSDPDCDGPRSSVCHCHGCRKENP